MAPRATRIATSTRGTPAAMTATIPARWPSAFTCSTDTPPGGIGNGLTGLPTGNQRTPRPGRPTSPQGGTGAGKRDRTAQPSQPTYLPNVATVDAAVNATSSSPITSNAFTSSSVQTCPSSASKGGTDAEGEGEGESKGEEEGDSVAAGEDSGADDEGDGSGDWVASEGTRRGADPAAHPKEGESISEARDTRSTVTNSLVTVPSRCEVSEWAGSNPPTAHKHGTAPSQPAARAGATGSPSARRSARMETSAPPRDR